MVKRAKTRLPSTDYVAGLIHDLKNPLGAAVGNVAFVREQLGTDMSDCAEALDDASDALRRIGALADELLTVSQYEAAALIIGAETVRVRDVFESVARSMAREVELRETTLVVLPPGDLELTADRGLLTRALESMIAWTVRQMSRGAGVELSARDDGSEIEIVTLRRLQSPPDDVPRALHAAECIAAAHGGSLEVLTREDRTALALRLPRAPA